MVDFGSNLKELRLKYKMTQKELADKIGVTDYLLGIEHKHTIDVSNLSSEEIAVVEQMVNLLEHKK